MIIIHYTAARITITSRLTCNSSVCVKLDDQFQSGIRFIKTKVAKVKRLKLTKKYTLFHILCLRWWCRPICKCFYSSYILYIIYTWTSLSSLKAREKDKRRCRMWKREKFNRGKDENQLSIPFHKKRNMEPEILNPLWMPMREIYIYICKIRWDKI